MRMRKLLPLTVVLLLIALGGCDLLLSQAGSGTIQLSYTGGTQARSIGPGISVDIDHYVVSGESVRGQTFTETVSEPSVAFPGLSAGYWDIVVDAYNESSVRLYTGSDRVFVNRGSTVSVMIPLVAVSGVGTLNIDLSWPDGELASPIVDAMLVPAVGDATPLAFAVDGAAASFSSNQIDSGFHTLVVKLEQDDVVVAGAVELVQIVNDQTTYGQLAFPSVNAPGSLEIGVDVTSDFQETLDVGITGGEVQSPFEVPVTLQGTVTSNLMNTVFTWYVNGSAVDSGVEQTIIPGDIPGHYRVDLIVVTADGSEGGMATTWVDILEPAL